MRIVLTGGGTAGHITPNIALIALFRKKGFDVFYAGAAGSMEEKLIGEAGVPFYPVKTGKLRRYFDLKNLSDPFRVAAGVFQSAELMRRLKPDVVFAKGGFVSVPVVAGAYLCGVPCVLHESDRSPGLANRLCIPLCKRICTAFPETAGQIGKKAVCTGLPVRADLFTGERARGRARCGFKDGKPALIVMGGSQGAVAVNATLRGALPELLKRFDVIHLCGAGNLDAALEGRAGYYQTEYADKDLPDFFAASDIALSRAGAGALFEFAALEIPALVVPLPLTASRGDQIENAAYFEKRGWLRTLPQERLDASCLTREIDALWEARARIKSALSQADMRGAAERVAHEICAAAGRGRLFGKEDRTK